ncbi:coumaroyl-CoA:anthocyanidin 3-O-glucoside-6''-O-coumaroyltransferase 1-like [Telopea speciosissima]|uniref:coumaroyl-CoA:anthocyanidin 3-O-glucoside-6''-O-coumaroyltransferase 1-like n=1 Tax=Telopea speciosissima TaxID=54955 RepID=UPI001CC76A3B|nr:coumaroyl-CoA:anthocyanidin 3-O-glucoside-6''-O-coumaroyltransferase 1-like [Telopea speciosissima]
MADHTNPVKVMEHCNISPPPGSVGNKSLPLTFFDIFWLPPYPLVKPELCYVDGDSVSLTLAESDSDLFHYLSGNQARDVNQFHFLVPNLIQSSIVDHLNFSDQLLALQVTLFPYSGICMGVTASHVVLDGRTLVHFMKSWASISRSSSSSSGVAASLSPDSLPFYDRNVINDQKVLKMIYLN